MRVNKSLVLSVAAGAAFAVPALANDGTPVMPFGGTVRVDPVGFPGQPYSGRAIETVYDNVTNAFGANQGNIIVLGSTNVIDDISFTPGPWGASFGGPRLATEFLYTFQVSGCTGTLDYEGLFDFWDTVNFTVNPMATGTNLGQFRVRLNNANNCGFIWQFTSSLTGLPGGGIAFPDATNAVQIRAVQVGTTTLMPFASAGTGTQNVFPAFGFETVARVGSSTPSYGRDVNGDSVFVGGSPAIVGGGAGAHEHRVVSTQANAQSFLMRLKGDVPPPPPPGATALGTLSDAGLSRTSDSVAAGQVRWYSFTLSAAADADAITFLDIDTENGAGSFDIGLYNDQGQLVAADVNDGSGDQAQLTFGVCRRAAPGDGLQYDGRDARSLPAGNYLIAVTTDGGTFSGAYNAGGGTGTGGQLSLNLATNVNGTPAAPSVPPAVDVTQDAGIIAAPGAAYPIVASGLRGVQWFKFTLDQGVCDASDTYLDIDMLAGTATGDTEIALFDSSGNLVAEDDDSGPGTLSQLSFGDTTNPRPASGDGLPYDGFNGDLAAGEYYLAAGLFDVGFLPSRWCVYPTSGSNLDLGPSITTAGLGCGSGGCPADFDGDGGVTFDDLTGFIGAWEAGDVAADFDGDGGVTFDDLTGFLGNWEAGC